MLTMAEGKCNIGILKLVAFFPLLLILVVSVEYFVMLELHTKISAIVMSTERRLSNSTFSVDLPHSTDASLVTEGKVEVAVMQENNKSNIVTEEIPVYAHVVDDDPTRPCRTLSPFEERGGNIVLTIRTTVSLHKKRLPLLMETWLTVANCSQIYLVTDGRDPEAEAIATKLGV